MPGPSPVPCTFPDDFVQVALDTVRRRTVPVQDVQRFRLVLLLHEQPDMKNDKAAMEVGLSARQVLCVAKLIDVKSAFPEQLP